jgi:hypothetical protein
MLIPMLCEKSEYSLLSPDGTKSLQSSSTQFAIEDREYLALEFFGKIKVLNFSLKKFVISKSSLTGSIFRIVTFQLQLRS